MAVNWGLGLAPDIIGTAMNAFEQGKQMRREDASRNAMAAILRPTPVGQTPGIGDGVGANRPDPYSQLTPQDMATVQQFQQRQSQIEQRQREASAEQVRILGNLISGVQDEPSYQRALAAARSAGIDVSKAPPTYNPEYVAQSRLLVSAYQKDGGQSLSTFGKIAQDEGFQPGTPQYNARVTQLVQADAVKTIPYTQGGGVAGFNPLTGTTSSIVQPNPGGYTTGAPVQQPPASFSEGQTATNPNTGEKVVFRGGQWVPLQGGPTPRASGGFRP